MPVTPEATNLLLLEDLEDVSRTRELAQSDLDALQAVADWIKTVPFLLVRQAVISDWKFFLDNEDWLKLWAHRYGESGVQALAEKLRRMPRQASRVRPIQLAQLARSGGGGDGGVCARRALVVGAARRA